MVRGLQAEGVLPLGAGESLQRVFVPPEPCSGASAVCCLGLVGGGWQDGAVDN